MPKVGLPQPPSTTPPRAGSTCAYLSSPTLGARLSRLPGRPGGEPSERGISRASAGT
jgi:hypothetical protein